MDRQRVWRAHFSGRQPDDRVLVRHYAVLAPGDDLVDDPPTEVMTYAEWQTRCAEFGCSEDGLPLVSQPGVGRGPDAQAPQVPEAGGKT